MPNSGMNMKNEGYVITSDLEVKPCSIQKMGDGSRTSAKLRTEDEQNELFSTLLASFDNELSRLTEDPDVYVELDCNFDLDSDFEVDWSDSDAAIVTEINGSEREEEPGSPNKRPRTDSWRRSLFANVEIPRPLCSLICGADTPTSNLAFYQELLLLIWHSHRCTRQLGECLLSPNACAALHRLFRHACVCRDDSSCEYHSHGCAFVKDIMRHYKECNKIDCAVCSPVRRAVTTVTTARPNACQKYQIGSSVKAHCLCDQNVA